MSDRTSIEWTDATVNAVNGCSVVSPGCTNCYAMRLAGTRMRSHPSRKGLTTDSKAGPVWNGKVRLNETALMQPLHWTKPRKIFWNAHGDLFHPAVPDAWIDKCFAVMALTPHHVHQVLTKRPARMRAYFAERWQPAPARTIDMRGHGPDIEVPAETRPGDRWDQIDAAIDDITIDSVFNQARFWTKDGSLIGRPAWPRQPLPNVWLGVSVEDQERADERIPDLLATPAAVRFLSCEPLLGPLDLTSIKAPRYPDEPEDSREIDWRFDALTTGDYYWFDVEDGVGDCGDGPYRESRIDWVIAGGESGPGSRPMHPDWVRNLRDQCAKATLDGDDAPVPFLFKQWGEWTPGENVRRQSGWVPGAHWFDQRWLYEDQNLAATDGHIDDEPDLYRVGKKAAGRLLDGVQHDGMPA